jgi:hypothetical protein
MGNVLKGVIFSNVQNIKGLRVEWLLSIQNKKYYGLIQEKRGFLGIWLGSMIKNIHAVRQGCPYGTAE